MNDGTRFQFKIVDHLGNTVVLFEDKDGDDVINSTATDPTIAEVLQRNLYYPFGLGLEGEWADETAPKMKYLYNGKELNSDFGLDWSDYGARYYDAAIGRWGQIDPLAESYYSTSSYAYVLNNPIALIDPNGMYAAPPSTHTDKDGNVIAVYEDGDKGVYRHADKTTAEQVNAVYSTNNTSAGGEKMGETISELSFFNPSDGKAYGKIDFNSYAAAIELESFESRIAEYDKTHGMYETLMYYMRNAGTSTIARPQIFDYKTVGGEHLEGDELMNYRYHGSQLSKGIYASARDIGNVEAGFLAAVQGIPERLTYRVMGTFNRNSNRLDINLIGTHMMGPRHPPYGETWNSHLAQKYGYQLGESRWNAYMLKVTGYDIRR